MLGNEAFRFRLRDPPVPQIQGRHLGHAAVAALQILDVVAHALHPALDLFVGVVLERHVLHVIPLPVELTPYVLHVSPHIPRDEGPETDRAALEAPKLSGSRVGKWLKISWVTGEIPADHPGHIFGRDTEVDISIEPRLVDFFYAVVVIVVRRRWSTMRSNDC